jgi:hypothetical protein
MPEHRGPGEDPDRDEADDQRLAEDDPDEADPGGQHQQRGDLVEDGFGNPACEHFA